MKVSIIFLFSYIMISSQIGIGTQVPTNTLDVNGTVRVRNISEQLMPNVSYVLVTNSQGLLQKATPLDMIYSSGLYVRSVSNDNWNNIYIGTKATRLDFTGRIADYGNDFTFSVFYKKNEGFKVISQNSIQIIPINATSFSINLGAVSYLLQFTISTTFATIKATKTSGGAGWSQGTFRSLPILD